MSMIPALCGAIIGGLFTLLGSKLATDLQAKEKKKHQDEIEYRFIQSIYTEIDSVYNRYKELSKTIQNSKLLLEAEMLIKEDYFSIYHNNASYIGLIKNDELRDSIINFYIQAKGMIDSIRANNQLWEKYSKSQQDRQQNILEELQRYLLALKIEDKKLRSSYKKISKIRKLTNTKKPST